MPTTYLTNLFDPEVIGERLNKKLTDYIRFAPMAYVGRNLVNNHGSTVTIPSYEYIGTASDVAEGVTIPTSLLTTSTYTVTVKKACNAVGLTDEAVLAGWGDPLGEAERQLGVSIADKVDVDCYNSLSAIDGTGGTQLYTAGVNFSLDVVADALAVFLEDIDDTTYLIINANQYAILRKEDDFVHVGNGAVKVTGEVGNVYGTTVVVSNKVQDTEFFLLRQDGLGIELKRSIQVESERDTLAKTTYISADQHYVTYLRNVAKSVKGVVTTV